MKPNALLAVVIFAVFAALSGRCSTSVVNALLSGQHPGGGARPRDPLCLRHGILWTGGHRVAPCRHSEQKERGMNGLHNHAVHAIGGAAEA